MTTNGAITMASVHQVRETIDRFEAEVKARGLAVFARIDHGAGAAAVGLPLRPTELLIFGHAKSGTPLMQMNQIIGIDLPLKALAWEDADGKTWLSYSDPAALAQRHGLGAESDRVVGAIKSVLEAVAQAATKP